MSAENEYRRAWERLKAGKPQRVGKDLPINDLNTVALEAGKKKGSLRTKQYPDLCEEIKNYVVQETDIQREIRLKEHYRIERDEKHQLWSEALARELMLKIRLEEFEKEIARIKQAYPGIVFQLND